MKSFDKTWEEIHSTQAWGQYPSEPIIRFVARNFYKANPRKAIKILDFGCGGGAHTWYLAREGFTVFAFDGSQSAVENTRKKLEKEFGICSVDLRVRDAINLDYDINSFDAIIDSVCVCANTLNNIRLMYNEMYSILKPGGKIITTGFGYKTTGYDSGKQIEKNTFTDINTGNLAGRGVIHFWNEVEIKQILSDAGFNNIHIDSDIYTDKGSVVENLITTAEK